MIKFNSVSDANTVINKLLLEDSLWNSANDTQYGNYTVDQLDSIDLAINFDEFKKFREFENLFPGFVSKRKSLETLENTWLNNNLTGTDPDNLDFTFDDAENTVFNNQNKFKIGTNIYELKVDGLYINGVFQGDGGSQFVTNAANPCISGRRHNFYSEVQVPNRKYKLKVAVHSIGIRSSAKGKVVSLKLKSTGGYKRSRAQLGVICGGNIYSTNCSFNFAFGIRKPSPSGFLKRRELKVVYRQWGAGGQIVYKTRPNETSATFQLASGFSANILLF